MNKQINKRCHRNDHIYCSGYNGNRHCMEKINSMKNLLTIRDPIASHVEPESSVAPIESFRNNLIHHGHIKVDGVIQKQRVNRTLYTQDLVN